LIVKIVEGSQDIEWQMIGKMIVKIPWQVWGKIYSFYRKTYKNWYN